METKHSEFTIKAMYKVLDAIPTISFPSANIWGVRVQPKIYLYASLLRKQLGEKS